MEKFNQLTQEDSKKEEEVNTKEIELDNIGLRLLGLNKNTRTRYNVPSNVYGAVITAVKNNSIAANSGLNVGSVISQISQKEIKMPKDAKKILDDAVDKNLESVLIQVYEEGFSRFLILKLK